jgi:hypothetical protein
MVAARATRYRALSREAELRTPGLCPLATAAAARALDAIHATPARMALNAPDRTRFKDAMVDPLASSRRLRLVRNCLERLFKLRPL